MVDVARKETARTSFIARGGAAGTDRSAAAGAVVIAVGVGGVAEGGGNGCGGGDAVCWVVQNIATSVVTITIVVNITVAVTTMVVITATAAVTKTVAAITVTITAAATSTPLIATICSAVHAIYVDYGLHVSDTRKSGGMETTPPVLTHSATASSYSRSSVSSF